MARIEDIERRLQNWARWKHGAGSGGLGFSAGGGTFGGGSGSRYREAVVPTSDCEASDTDLAVNDLEARLRLTVCQVYLTGDSPAIDAAMLGCTESAVKARIWQAHARIEAWFTGREAARRAERDRVEALQRRAGAG
jgi:hypothetical protein